MAGLAPAGWLARWRGALLAALLWAADTFGWLYFLAQEAYQGLSALATVAVDPAGYGAAPHPLRPPVVLGRRAAALPGGKGLFPAAHAFRVACSDATRPRNARAASWVYRWHPTPDLGDWRKSVADHLGRYLGGPGIPSHTIELLGADGRPLGETLAVLIVDPAGRGAGVSRRDTRGTSGPAELHLTYSNEALGGDPLQITGGTALAALDPSRMIEAARGAALAARGGAIAAAGGAGGRKSPP